MRLRCSIFFTQIVRVYTCASSECVKEMKNSELPIIILVFMYLSLYCLWLFYAFVNLPARRKEPYRKAILRYGHLKVSRTIKIDDIISAV